MARVVTLTAAPAGSPTGTLGAAELGRLLTLIDPPGPAQRYRGIRVTFGGSSRTVPIEEVLVLETVGARPRVLTSDDAGWADLAPDTLDATLPPGEFWQIGPGLFLRAREIARSTPLPSGGRMLRLRSRRECFEASPAFARPFRTD